MQEISVWTWRREDLSEYDASAIPALWRRVADRPWQDARREFGRLAYYDELIRTLNTDPDTGRSVGGSRTPGEQAARIADNSDWKLLDYRLKHLAALWRPAADDPTIHHLDLAALARDPDATALRVMLNVAANDGELMPQMNGWQLEIMPRSLRAFLLVGCAADIAARRRFRRCDQCNEWFSPTRSDARYCSNACRQAAHVSRMEA